MTHLHFTFVKDAFGQQLEIRVIGLQELVSLPISLSEVPDAFYLSVDTRDPPSKIVGLINALPHKCVGLFLSLAGRDSDDFRKIENAAKARGLDIRWS